MTTLVPEIPVVPDVTTPADDDGLVVQPPPPPPPPLRWTPLGEPGVGGLVTAVAVDPMNPDRVLLGGDLLGIAYSDDGGRSWQRAAGLLSHEVARFTFHPDRPGEVWVGTMSGPHVSMDGGRSWEPRRAGLPPIEDFFYSAPIEVVLVDLQTPGRLVAFGGSHREWQSLGEPAWGAVWESIDDGATWTRVSTIAGGANIVAAIQLDDGTMLAAAQDQGVHRSTDAGRTWDAVGVGLPHGNVRDLAAVPGGRTVYATLAEGPLDGAEHLAGGVYRSDDGGISWEIRSEGLTQRRSTNPALTSRYDSVVVSAVRPETVWTAELAFGLEAVYRSDDGGETWTVELEGDGAADVQTAYSSPVTGEVLVADSIRNELRFVAQGEYVLRREPDGEWIDATSSEAGDGRRGTGYSGLVATGITFNPEVPGHLGLNALDGGQYLRSDDAGETWTRPLTAWDQWGGSQSMAIAGPRGDHEYVLLGQFGQFNGIAASTDAGRTWQFAAGAGAGLPNRFEAVGSIGDIVALDSEPERVLATIGGSIYVSTDAAATWTRTLEGSFSALVKGVDEELYVADLTGVYRLDRLGAEAELLDGSPTAVDKLTVDPTTGVLYSVRWGVDDNTDGLISRWDGATWTQLCLEPPSCGSGLDRYAADLAVDPTDPNHLIVATNDLPFHDVVESRGVFQSTDGGQTWTPLNDGLTFRRVGVVAFDPHRPERLVIGTMGGGFFEGVFSD